MEDKLEYIENIDLIENGCNHILHEFEASKRSYFRIALESHNILLRAMVEVLRGTSNSIVTNKFSDKEKRMVFKVGNSPWRLIKKDNIENCRYAWRFSKPEVITDYSEKNVARDIEDRDYLIGFYDLLAMIQCDFFMIYHTQAKTIVISDEELCDLEWLHQSIRNKYEHFVPSAYGAPINDLLFVSLLCNRICQEILVDSRNIYFVKDYSIFKTLLKNIKEKIETNLE